MASNQLTPKAKLVSQGWEKQATYDDPRLSEMVEVYRGIGFEVHLEPFNPANEKDCSECLARSPDQFKTIYTRRKKK